MLLALLLCAAPLLAEPPLGEKLEAEPLRLGIRGHSVAQHTFSLFAAPGESLRLDLADYDVDDMRLSLEGKPFGTSRDGFWEVPAPRDPGLYVLSLENGPLSARMRLNLFVGRELAPGQEELNGYLIGPAPPGSVKYPGLYPAPRLYFEVTEDNVDMPLSDHFTLRQFLCKQESDFPKYLAMKESLLVLLEGLVETVREAGYPVQTFGVISGYRTSWYNRKIGNVPNSRHVYGDAMDFFVDLDGDDRMDDLDGNGTADSADVDLLFDIVEQYKRRPENTLLVGGVGRYYATSAHGGFVHVDARGFRARW